MCKYDYKIIINNFFFLQDYEHYSNLDVEKMQDARIPLLFISFPSAKDPNWNLHPGRKDKSTCAIITLARWEWYEKWQNRPLKRRGDDYDAVIIVIIHIIFNYDCAKFIIIHIDKKFSGSSND